MTRSGSTNLLAEIEAGSLDSSADLPGLLRKCVALGGATGSARLREWATRELKGYGPEDELPPYRVARALLFGDGVAHGNRFTGQQIPLRLIPEGARPVFQGDIRLAYSLAELIGLAATNRAEEGESLRLAPPGAQESLALMNHTLAKGDHSVYGGDLPFPMPPSQVLERIYWMLSITLVTGIVDVVRTTLVELVAEMRAGTPAGVPLPTHEVAEQAVGVAIYGHKNRVVVNQVASGGTGAATVSGVASTGDADPESKPRRWMFWVAGVAGVVVAVAAVITLVLS